MFYINIFMIVLQFVVSTKVGTVNYNILCNNNMMYRIYVHNGQCGIKY